MRFSSLRQRHSLGTSYALPPLVGVLFAAAYGSLRAEPDLTAIGLLLVAGLSLGLLTGALGRRHHRERAARLDAEDISRRVTHLQELTAALSSARTSADVIDACVLETTHGIGAASGALVLVAADEESGELARAVGFPDDTLAHWNRLPLRPKTPFGTAIRSRSIVAHDSRAARTAEYGDLADAEFLAEHEATAVVPLTTRGRVVAVLGIGLSEPRTWTAGDRDFLRQTAVHAARALERAGLYEIAERARVDAEALRARADQELAERQRAEEALRDSEARYRALAARTSRLHGLTGALSEAVTLDAVARAVVRQGQLVAGAQGASVTMLVDNGAQLTILAEDGPGASRTGATTAVEPGLCETEAIDTRQPVFVGSFGGSVGRYWRSASQAADGGYESTAALPLLAKGAPIGVLSFHFAAPVNFDDDYRALLTSVAQHCAQALDRARLHEAEHRARAEAEAANRLKDDFLSTVSHELRTPLNALLGWSAMLRLGTLDASRTGRAIQAIHDNATRQAQLVDELLDVSRIASGRAALELQEIDLRGPITSAVEWILPLAEEKAIEVRVPPHVPVRVTADGRRLEQVFLNLLSNAVKFTPPGGRVSVDVIAADGAVEVRVSDTGVGIDASFLPHVFDRFRQAESHTTRTHGGLGLGLSIAKQLVEAHGGSIRAESAGCGEGALFTVTLPIAASRHKGDQAMSGWGALSAVEGPALSALPSLDGVRVLIVDDERDAREMMACALANCGAAVTTAVSAGEALDALRRTAFDVLLADIGMPDEDGYTLIRKVRALPAADRAAIPAAAVTAYAREDQRQQALAAGYQLHVAKPVDPARLARAVSALRAGASASQAGLSARAAGRRPT